MKHITSILLLALSMTMTVTAQQAPSGGTRVATEIIASSSSAVVKGAPYSAEAVSESVQMLADGNKISRSNTTKMYRDSEGRTRRENDSSNNGAAPVVGAASGFGTSLSTAYGSDFFTFSGFGFQDTVSIFDPVGNVRYSLNPTAKTARRTKAMFGMAEGALFATTVQSAGSATRAQVDANAAKRTAEVAAFSTGQAMSPAAKAEIDAATAARRMQTGTISGGIATTIVNGDGGFGGTVIARGSMAGKTESLGTRDIEGVAAEGTRTVTTIPAGAIGNENPIEIVYERWYSKELQLIVYSRHNDPRFGEQTYRLTNVSRSEPDRSLFAPPADYKILAEPSMNVFTTRPREENTAKPREVVNRKPQ